MQPCSLLISWLRKMCLGTTGADLTVNLWEEGWTWRGYRAVLGEEDVTRWQCRLVSGDRLSRCLYFTEGSVRTHTHRSTQRLTLHSTRRSVGVCALLSCSFKVKGQAEGPGELLPPGPPGHPAKGNPFGLVVATAVNSMQRNLLRASLCGGWCKGSGLWASASPLAVPI